MDNISLDLNLLRVFEAMIRDGSVTVASRRIGLSQPAMSSAIGRLRHHFGDPLFVKTRGGMHPTPRALELAGPIGEALALIRRAMTGREAFDPATASRTFRIYMTDVGEAVCLPPLIEKVRAAGLRLAIRTAQPPADQLAALLESGEFDVAIGYLPRLEEPVRRLRMFDEHYVCMTRSGHPFGRQERITLSEYLAADHVLNDSMGGGHEAVERALQARGLERNIALRLPHFVVISLIVANSDLVVTIPRRLADVISEVIDVKVHALPIPIPHFDVDLYWHQRFENDPGIRWLRTLIAELFVR